MCQCLIFLFFSFSYIKLYFHSFRNIEEILAEKGEKVKKVTLNTENFSAEKLAETSSNIELVLGENNSNIFQAAKRDDSEGKNEK